MRFGVEGCGVAGSAETVTFAEIGKQIGLSKERVRQISMQAIDNLQEVARVQFTHQLELLT